jgi:hypothetical protein
MAFLTMNHRFRQHRWRDKKYREGSPDEGCRLEGVSASVCEWLFEWARDLGVLSAWSIDCFTCSLFRSRVSKGPVQLIPLSATSLLPLAFPASLSPYPLSVFSNYSFNKSAVLFLPFSLAGMFRAGKPDEKMAMG